MTVPRFIKVLVIEGDSDVRSRIRFCFSACGNFDLEFCSPGLEMMDFTTDFLPDVIILDASLSVASGRSALLALHSVAEMEDIPVIFAASGCPESEIRMLRDLGVSDVVERPFDLFAIPGQVLKTWHHADA